MTKKRNLFATLLFTTTALTIPQADTVNTNVSLVPLAFSPLPVGAIIPSGWLEATLQTSAAGLAGHEHDFYPWVADSSWTGGNSEYSELNEGLPYWFNGLVPMAYILDDERLKTQVHVAAEYILSHQGDDGWIGPEAVDYRTFWGRYPLFLGLIQLAEANETWTDEIVTRLYKFNRLMHSMMQDNYTGYMPQQGDGVDAGDFGWGRARYQDMMITLMWLYENHPGSTTQQQQLVDNLNFLNNGSIHWEDWYNAATYVKADLYSLSAEQTESIDYMFLHGVNIGQSLKAMAVVRRLTHNDSMVQTAMDSVNWTMTYHGGPHGSVIADERMDGVSPYSGAETCTHVETMYSLTYNYLALGDGYYADRAELVAFNALPASLSPDWWAHQYMLQTNQPWAKNLSERIFFNVNTLGQTFGLEPNYPCCAVNHPQGMPKFLTNSFATYGSNGLVHALLGPASVTTKLESGDVQVKCSTKYPFGVTLTYDIKSDGAFDFYVRVPTWYDSASSSINGKPLAPSGKSMVHKISISSGSSSVTYKLGSSVRTEPRANDTVAVYHGALLYSLDISSENTTSTPRRYNNQTFYPESFSSIGAKDYMITNTSAWNYAIDPSTLQFHSGDAESNLANPIFAPGAPSMYITVQACQIEWPLFNESTPGAALPKEDRKCTGDVEQVRLVPFGAAKLHMAELPTISFS